MLVSFLRRVKLFLVILIFIHTILGLSLVLYSSFYLSTFKKPNTCCCLPMSHCILIIDEHITKKTWLRFNRYKRKRVIVIFMWFIFYVSVSRYVYWRSHRRWYEVERIDGPSRPYFGGVPTLTKKCSCCQYSRRTTTAKRQKDCFSYNLKAPYNVSHVHANAFFLLL